MLYLSEQNVEQLLDGKMKETVALMRDVFEIVETGDFTMGGENGKSHGFRLPVEMLDHQLYLAMPGYLGGKYNSVGVKWHGPNKFIGDNDSDIYYTMIVNDVQTGKPMAIMRADLLTRYRTAATAALAAECLAQGDPVEIGVIGSGRINYLSLQYLLERFDSIKRIKIKGRGEDSRNQFIDRLRRESTRAEVSAADTIKDAVQDSDIVLINTGFSFQKYSDMPMIKSSYINKPTVFVCSSFAHFSDQDITERTINVCDMFAIYENYIEELGYPAFKKYGSPGSRFADLVVDKKLRKEDVIDLSNIISGNKVISKDNTRPVIFSSTGMSLEDLALAEYLYKAAKRNSIGKELD